MALAAQVGVPEREFWGMSLRSFYRIVWAWRRRQREQHEILKAQADAEDRRTAWMIAEMINWSGKSRADGLPSLTADDLLGTTTEQMTYDTYHAELAALQERQRALQPKAQA